MSRFPLRALSRWGFAAFVADSCAILCVFVGPSVPPGRSARPGAFGDPLKTNAGAESAAAAKRRAEQAAKAAEERAKKEAEEAARRE